LISSIAPRIARLAGEPQDPASRFHRWLEAMSPIEVIQTEKRDLDKAPSASESDVSIISKERWVGANLRDIEGRVPDGGKSPSTRWASLA
jgi:hypothetical protein